MRHSIRFFCLGLTLALFSGCIEMEEDYTVNPDGSGKLVRVATVDAAAGLGALSALGGPAAKPPTAKEKDEMKKGVVLGMLQNSPGIEAWKDVTSETLTNGRIQFKGTGYFKDIAAVSSTAGGMTGGGKSGESGFSLTKGPKETLILEMKDLEASLPIGGKKSGGVKKTDQEIDAQIKKERGEFASGKLLMGAMFSKLKIKQSFHLPGRIAESSNLKNEGGAVSISIEGEKLIQSLDAMMADDKFMRLQVQAESDPSAKEQVTAMSMEKMFGQKGPVRAVVAGPFTAQFDYEAEASEARKGYPALLKQYEDGSIVGRPKGGGNRATRPERPATAVVGDSLEGTENEFLPRLKKGETFTSYKVTEVRTPKPSKTAAAEAAKKITVTLLGQLPGTILDVNFGKLLTAVEEGGESLLAKEEWDRQMFVFKLEGDKNAVSFDVNLYSPSGKAGKAKEISGTLEVTLGGIKAVDLGLTEFKDDARGTMFDARIRSISRDGGGHTLYLQLNQKKEAVNAVAFFDASGQKLNGSVKNWSNVGEISIVGYSLDTAFPSSGRVKVAIIENSGKAQIPFKLENVSLTDLSPQ